MRHANDLQQLLTENTARIHFWPWSKKEVLRRVII